MLAKSSQSNNEEAGGIQQFDVTLPHFNVAVSALKERFTTVKRMGLIYFIWLNADDKNM